MKAEALLMFFINYITISLSFEKEEINATELVSEKLTFSKKNCSKLLKIIQDNKIEEYTSNCKTTVAADFKINEETILRNTCHVAEYVVDLICENQYFQEANKYLNLHLNNNSICPFNFSILSPYDNSQFFSMKTVVELLSNETICLKTCYDLFDLKSQCAVLHNSFEYLKIIKEHKEKKGEIFLKSHNHQINFNSLNGGSSKPLHVESKEKFPLTLNNTTKDKYKGNRNFETTNHNSEPFTKIAIYKNNITTYSKTDLNLNDSGLIESQDASKNHSNSTQTQVIQTLISKPVEENNEINSEVIQQNSEVPEYSDEFLPQTRQNSFTNKLNYLKEEKQNLPPSQVHFHYSDFPENSDRLLPQTRQSSLMNKLNYLKEEKQNLLPSRAPFQSLLSENQLYSRERLLQTEESHFIFYFLMLSVFVIIGYFAFHNKNKILAYALEGKNNRRHRRRSNSIKYKKLESNLQEVIVSDLPHVTSANIVY